MSTKVIRATGANVSPAEDARLFKQIFSADGLFDAVEINATGGSQVYIPPLYGIMQGRDFTTDPIYMNVELPNSDGAGFIIVRFDTTTDNIISIKSELAPYTPVYENINAGGNICEMILATYTASPTQITSLSMTYTKANFGGMMQKTLLTGETALTFTNPVFNSNTLFDFYSDAPYVNPVNWSFSGTTLTVMFKKQAEAHEIRLIYNNMR